MVYGSPVDATVNGPLDGATVALALVLGAVAVTLWCTDGLTPMIRDGSTTIVQLWGDSFVHARHISAFAQAQGFASMSDIRMWGSPPYLYHYASYAIPAAVSAMLPGAAYEVFASFLLPVGVLLTGLAAFAFAGSVWGRWPAVAASFAILLVPDAYQQGFGNKYLSYNFMQQVNVGGLYGVACMAVAWIFVLHGCRSRNVASILLGWAVAFVALPYKAHVFVANAFLIMVYPCLFLAKPGPRWRVAIATALTACFVLAVMLSQRFDRVPTLSLDGSSARTYIAYLLANHDPGLAKSVIEYALGDPPWSAPALVVCGAALVLLGTFGYWSVIAMAAAMWIRKRVHAAVWAFPLLVMANYLIMALGLAMDTKEIGSPDELLNRPLVWAYFAVVAWTGGAVYHLALRGRPAAGDRDAFDPRSGRAARTRRATVFRHESADVSSLAAVRELQAGGCDANVPRRRSAIHSPAQRARRRRAGFRQRSAGVGHGAGRAGGLRDVRRESSAGGARSTSCRSRRVQTPGQRGRDQGVRGSESHRVVCPATHE